MDRVALFNDGQEKIKQPMTVFKLAGIAASGLPRLAALDEMNGEELAAGLTRKAVFGGATTMAVFEFKKGPVARCTNL